MDVFDALRIAWCEGKRVKPAGYSENSYVVRENSKLIWEHAERGCNTIALTGTYMDLNWEVGREYFNFYTAMEMMRAEPHDCVMRNDQDDAYYCFQLTTGQLILRNENESWIPAELYDFLIDAKWWKVE